MDQHAKSSDEPSLEELLSNLPPILPPTHCRFPSTPSKIFLAATAGPKPLPLDEFESAEADRLFELVERTSGPI